MQVVWTTPARKHLTSAIDYIAEQNPVAAYRVGISIRDSVGALADNPWIGRRGRIAKTRELILSDLPYIVVYRVTDRVEILAVIHASRKWPEKL